MRKIILISAIMLVFINMFAQDVKIIGPKRNQQSTTINRRNNQTANKKRQTTQAGANDNKARHENSSRKPSVLVLDGHECVDLGLPSGTKWATMNVGATSPEDYGDYYAWGETETKSEYEESTYMGMSSDDDCGTDKDPLKAYVKPNNKSIAGTRYDVAHVKWGGKWKMPTLAQIEELCDSKYCTTEWTGNYKGTGVSGRIITSKVKGYAGNFIFLPAAGYRTSSSLNYDGSYGTCWSATPYSSGAYYACSLGFISVHIEWSYFDRYYGQSVRPVSE